MSVAIVAAKPLRDLALEAAAKARTAAEEKALKDEVDAIASHSAKASTFLKKRTDVVVQPASWDVVAFEHSWPHDTTLRTIVDKVTFVYSFVGRSRGGSPDTRLQVEGPCRPMAPSPEPEPWSPHCLKRAVHPWRISSLADVGFVLESFESDDPPLCEKCKAVADDAGTDSGPREETKAEPRTITVTEGTLAFDVLRLFEHIYMGNLHYEEMHRQASEGAF